MNNVDERGQRARFLARDAGHAETIDAWSGRPWPVVRGWVALSVAIALTLLAATWFVAGLLTPDLTPLHLPGLTTPSEPADMLPILYRNSLVLALHATACVAGFIAGASMPIAAAQRSASRAGSTSRPASWRSSSSARDDLLARHPGPLPRLPGLDPLLPAPHLTARTDRQRAAARDPRADRALPPLAAWLIASRRGEWNQLLAATFVTVAIAIPTLVIAAAIEVYVWPHILRSLSDFHYTLQSWTPPPSWR